MSDAVCVVHLVRHGNPPAWLERFLDSYRDHDAGADHRLVLLWKGFPAGTPPAAGLESLAGLAAQHVHVPDDGYDLTAYHRAAARLDGAVLCFLNSHSAILAAGWLARLRDALTPSVGLVGATASWNSAHSTARYLLHIPGAYDEVFPDRAEYLRESRRLPDDGRADDGSGPMSRPPLRYVRTASTLGRALALFPPFPAEHVRTNGFLLRRETMLRLRIPVVRRKLAAWRLESGRGSITEQVRAMGLDAVVAGRDGRVYRPPEWAASDTLWQADQANLLIADNHTERYRLGDFALRALLSKMAWGAQARPVPPS